MAGKHIKIGLAGLGTVGGGLWSNLERNRDLIESRSGIRLTIPMVAVRDMAKAKAFGVPADSLTTNWQDVTRSEDVDIVVELIGGVDTAYDLVMDAIDQGKVVVTGNKALLAERGAEIFKRAGEKGVPVFYEAAVAGGIPIIKALRESLIGNHVTGIYGIINGTSNYILTRMTDAGLSFADALKEASDLGYAEADPYLDISGWDAAHKAAILASIAYGSWVSIEDLHVEGIDGLSLSDVHYAERLGYAIKLLSVVKADDEGRIEVRTQPSLIPNEHILASVSGVFNAVAVHGDSSGESLYYGSGAGQDPTSSSVLADVVDAAYAVDTHQRGPGFVPHGHYGEVKPIEDTVSEYYLRITVTDQPGVIAGISTALAAHGIGIRATSSLKPGEMKEAGFDEVIFVLHASRYGTLLAALKEIEAFDYVTAPVVHLRVEQL
ncbi:homoserine dehydrogenase [Sulfuriroseicoccus oceanibius]|uniref:Homoserine dehydrogenase n=1 Tax=Sulfuriroseicoccus oceanibius TaxID=2707525 RepID=A0A6B3L0Q0_9BACT|nr:homoserine dehydrogenase [Sulfuriroseicoccus oceanibius]QQL44344.1 homoserine dehydrogenase [Sulfuriroseicoccus oceanibius]